jgi:hypothetical protein
LCAACKGVVAKEVITVRSPEGAPLDYDMHSGPRFDRSDDIVNWTIGTPWVRESSSVLPYEFSYHREIFRYIPLELRENSTQDPIGFVVLSVSRSEGRGCVKILDYKVICERYRSCVLHLAMEEAQRWSAEVIECGEEFGRVDGLRLLHRITMLKKKRPYYVFTRDREGLFGRRLHELSLGFCDGDKGFV